MRKLTKRSAAIVGAAVVAVGGLGVAAYASGWLVDGSGTANASSSEIKLMNADIVLSGNVFPGRSMTATAYVDNPNEFPVVLKTLTYKSVKVTSKKDNSNNTACSGTLTPESIIPGVPSATRITPGDDRQVTIPIVISDKLATACANSTFEVKFDFTGESAV